MAMDNPHLFGNFVFDSIEHNLQQFLFFVNKSINFFLGFAKNYGDFPALCIRNRERITSTVLGLYTSTK